MTTGTQATDKVYSFIGEKGSVTARDLTSGLGIPEIRADVWLRSQVRAGFLHEQSGRYATFCPIAR